MENLPVKIKVRHCYNNQLKGYDALAEDIRKEGLEVETGEFWLPAYCTGLELSFILQFGWNLLGILGNLGVLYGIIKKVLGSLDKFIELNGDVYYTPIILQFDDIKVKFHGENREGLATVTRYVQKLPEIIANLDNKEEIETLDLPYYEYDEDGDKHYFEIPDEKNQTEWVRVKLKDKTEYYSKI